MAEISWGDFEAIELRAGRILAVDSPTKDGLRVY